ncbi:hypothetical protein E2320_013620 [Naja naja]|nr:hypothetical protein E2320_013620 [Naja naja]
MAGEADSWDADTFEAPDRLAGRLGPTPAVVTRDRWAGEDEDDDVKDNWDDEEEEQQQEDEKESEAKPGERPGGGSPGAPRRPREAAAAAAAANLVPLRRIQSFRQEESSREDKGAGEAAAEEAGGGQEKGKGMGGRGTAASPRRLGGLRWLQPCFVSLLKLEESEDSKDLTPEEQLADKLRLQKLQEEADLELAKETFGVNNICGIDTMNPSSKDDFTEFGKLLKEKITQYEKSLYYAGFLETLVRDICISLEVDDLKKITNSLTVLCSEKQKQEKQNKAKKKKKGVVPGGGLKATMKDDLEDYGGYDGGYVQDFEDFM